MESGRRKLHHASGDPYDFVATHPDYKVEKEGAMVDCTVGDIFVEQLMKAVKLAALFFSQASGGPAVAEGSPSRDRRGDGHTRL